MQHTVNGVTTPYYFHRNPLGDVVGIYNTSGTLVAKYIYDAWGNCTISGNSAIAKANPIRYRGYYYDEETGLYYCNARYYSPKWRRFISPDDTSYLDPASVNGLNLSCYCNYDPVNYCDPTGHAIDTVFDFLSLVYDVYTLFDNRGYEDWKNWVALGFDFACLLLPFVSGGSTLYRVADGVDNINDIHDAINGLEIAGDMTDIAIIGRNADRVKGVGKLGYTYYNGLQSYTKLAAMGWYGAAIAEVAGKAQNASWLTKQLWKGRTIVDIGMGAGMAMSSSYRLERIILGIYCVRRYIRWGIRFALI